MAIVQYIGKEQKKTPPPTPAELREKADERARQAEIRERDARKSEEQIQKHATQRMQGQLILAKARHELIPKELVGNQAAFLFVALRQKIMQLPQTYARRILGLSDPAKARQILKEAAMGLLRELEDLPDKLTDPDFLKKIDAESKP